MTRFEIPAAAAKSRFKIFFSQLPFDNTFLGATFTCRIVGEW